MAIVVDGKVNKTALMLGLRSDGEATIRELVGAGIHPGDAGISTETAAKYGVELVNDPRANPFREGPGWNKTHQMMAVRADPKEAIQQILDAGREPQDFGIDPARYDLEVFDKEEPT